MVVVLCKAQPQENLFAERGTNGSTPLTREGGLQAVVMVHHGRHAVKAVAVKPAREGWWKEQPLHGQQKTMGTLRTCTSAWEPAADGANSAPS